VKRTSENIPLIIHNFLVEAAYWETKTR